MSPIPTSCSGCSFAQIDSDRVLRIGGFGAGSTSAIALVYSAVATSKRAEMYISSLALNYTLIRFADWTGYADTSSQCTDGPFGLATLDGKVGQSVV